MPKLPARPPQPDRRPAPRPDPAQFSAEFERLKVSMPAAPSRAGLPTAPFGGMHASDYLARMERQEIRQRQREQAELEARMLAAMDKDPGLKSAYAELYGEYADGE